MALLAPSAPGTQLQICFFLAQLHLTWSWLVSTDTILMVAVLLSASEMGVMVTLWGAGVLSCAALFKKFCVKRVGKGGLQPSDKAPCSHRSSTLVSNALHALRGAPSETSTSVALRWT